MEETKRGQRQSRAVVCLRPPSCVSSSQHLCGIFLFHLVPLSVIDAHAQGPFFPGSSLCFGGGNVYSRGSHPYSLDVVDNKSEERISLIRLLPSARSAAGAHLKFKDFLKREEIGPPRLGHLVTCLYRKRFSPHPVCFAPCRPAHPFTRGCFLFLLLLFYFILLHYYYFIFFIFLVNFDFTLLTLWLHKVPLAKIERKGIKRRGD